MTARESLYEAALAGARPLGGLAGALHPKLRRGLAGRRRSVAAFDAWATAGRDARRPLVWLHAPSAGEALMAQAIIAALRERRPDVQIAFTHFSPSAERLAGRVGADVHAYLPWDLRGPVRGALDALRPALVAFVRTEIWPVLTREAAARGARLALVNAVLAPGSSRLRPVSRFLLRPACGRLDAVGAVAEEDAARFVRVGAAPARVRVTGDARFDQVWQRVQALAAVGGAGGPESGRTHALLERLRDGGRTTLVAGSTWPPDEARIAPAFAAVRRDISCRLVIAPHEPDASHLGALERVLARAGLPHARLGDVERGDEPAPDVVIVDRVGILADLYSIGDLAYVGGGFHGAGLHSVIEPAALALPVLFGPRHANAREAGELARAGGGLVVHDEHELARGILELARQRDGRDAAGGAAAEFVRARLGAARRNAELLADLF